MQWSFGEEEACVSGCPPLTPVSAIILLCDVDKLLSPLNLHVRVCKAFGIDQIHISVDLGYRLWAFPESLFHRLVASLLCGFLFHFPHHPLGRV